ncbi:long-chain fatty acid--CoA ligase [Nocardia yamanashiensis]|uniref:AMP-dependent synthetase/ligase n=1 Tax=Nocardia yamanashiensis TaxID=209247 RepID=UPI001E33EA7B|nr:long-chain fatty acid--CoA ligase [Nocardia yamanashiensis]UGT41575.1 long-chain fatty acid--CoA ligase [Nocardia yamanashiensis]
MSDPSPRTLCEAFQSTLRAAWPEHTALRTLGDAVTVTWREYGDRVRSIAAGLAGLGIGRGDTVAFMMTNRPEFHLCDTAVLHTGATPFSIYNTNPPEVIGFQLDNSDAKAVICERQFLPAIRAGMAQGGKVEHLIVLDGAESGVLTLQQVEAAPAADFDFESAWRAVGPEDVVTLVYTSGTTGMPKAVEITHTNLLASMRLYDEMKGLTLGASDRLISYLPDAHMANRWLTHYPQMKYGATITTSADFKQVGAALVEVRPTLFLGVPRVWIKAKAGIEAAVAAKSPVERALLGWALATGLRVGRAKSHGREASLADRVQYAVADRLLGKIRAQLGLDQFRLAVSSTAPIPPEVLEFTLGLGVTVCEAWGLTEATCPLTINQPDHIRVGTVGTPVPGAEIKLAGDGEILARGPMIMRGYRKDPEKTAEAIDSDGWLHSGDVGAFDAEGNLKIVDRKKELIINAAGKNMSPANIENAITAHTALAGPVVAIGDGRQYNTALITLDPDAVTAFAAREGISGTIAELAHHPKVHERIQAGVDAANATLSRVEQVKKFSVVPEVWEPGSDYLTATNKLRRKPIATAYADRIDDMYS